MVREIFSQLSQASGSGARSTALAPIHIILAVILFAFLSCIYFGAHVNILILLGVAFSLVLLLGCGAYIYLLLKNPDALRSERFTLEKLRIERGLVGDNLSGLSDVNGGHSSKTFPKLPSNRK